MNEQILLDSAGNRRLIFDDVGVTHFTDELFFILPVPLPFIGFSVLFSEVTNRPIPYAEVLSVGVVRQRQSWALIMGLICAPLWIYLMVASPFTGRWWWSASCVLWFLLMGLFPLWLFYRGRPFLAIASEQQVICVPMDRKKRQLRRAFALLKEQVTSPHVRWEIDSI